MSCDAFEGLRGREDSVRYLGLLKNLKTLLEASQRRLRHLEATAADPDEILREQDFAKKVERQIRRLETQVFLSEFGVE
jgi:hypothetical protein